VPFGIFGCRIANEFPVTGTHDKLINFQGESSLGTTSVTDSKLPLKSASVFNTTLPVPVLVVTPVPPCNTSKGTPLKSIPKIPAPVIGPPAAVIKGVKLAISTLVTVPPPPGPAGVLQ